MGKMNGAQLGGTSKPCPLMLYSGWNHKHFDTLQMNRSQVERVVKGVLHPCSTLCPYNWSSLIGIIRWHRLQRCKVTQYLVYCTILRNVSLYWTIFFNFTPTPLRPANKHCIFTIFENCSF